MLPRISSSFAVAIATAACSGAASAPATLGASPLMKVMSQSGDLAIEVRTAPQPPTRGNDQVELTFTATDGTPVDGLSLAIKPWMPAMGHGTSIVPTITPESNGKYLITNVDLFMAGLWQIRTTISGPMSDYAAPEFEIQ